jgi:hypothetical protein
VTAFCVPGHGQFARGEMIHGIHKAMVALGALNVVSTVVFRSLKSGDGGTVSQHQVLHPGG